MRVTPVRSRGGDREGTGGGQRFVGAASVWEEESVLEMTVGVAAQQSAVPNGTGCALQDG